MKRPLFFAVGMLMLVVSLTIGAPLSAAQANEATAEPLYNSSTPQVDQSTWMNDYEEPTLESMIHYFSRVGSFVIGTDADNQASGPMLVGVLLFGAALGATMGTGVGTIAGGVLAVAGITAATAAGLAPQWTYPVILFGFGLVLSSALRRHLT